MTPDGPITPTRDGVCIRVQVQPRASRSRVVGLHGDALKIQIAAPPVDNAANQALIELLAERLGVPRRDVEVRAGSAARHKLLLVRGVDVARASAALLPAATAPKP